MKKLMVLIGAFLLAITLSGGALAASAERVVFQPGNSSYIINNSKLNMDAVPFVFDGRTYVPVRFLANALGAEDKLTDWDKSTGTVSLAFRGDNNIDINVQAGSSKLIVNYLSIETMEIINSKTVPMDVLPIIKEGRIYLPARWVAEACGLKVEWDSGTQSVQVCAPGTQIPSGEISVETREIKSVTDQLELDMQIPIISGLENKALQEQINQEVLDKAMQTRSELEDSYAEYAKSAKESGFPAHPFQLNVSYNSFVNGRVLSLVVETYQYSGGAHGMAWKDFYNLDTQDGKRLSLQELFKGKDDYITIINREIEKQIAEQINSGQGMYFEGDMGFISISPNHPFYIKDAHIIFCFGQYEIAPYAAGMPEFKVPMDLLSRQLREDFKKF